MRWWFRRPPLLAPGQIVVRMGEVPPPTVRASYPGCQCGATIGAFLGDLVMFRFSAVLPDVPGWGRSLWTTIVRHLTHAEALQLIGAWKRRSDEELRFVAIKIMYRVLVDGRLDHRPEGDLEILPPR